MLINQDGGKMMPIKTIPVLKFQKPLLLSFLVKMFF